MKVVIDDDHGEIIGCHSIGPEATELIAEAALSMSAEITAADLIWTVHAPPTLSEAVREAALAALGRGIHFWAGAPKEG